jgi:hypothetical protein
VNPRLGHGLSYEFVAKEFGKMTRANFGRERLGVPTFPRQAGDAWVIPEEAWTRCKDSESSIPAGAPIAFVLEADPELEYGTIGVAGRRQDKAMHLEAFVHEPGVSWMVDRAKDLQTKHGGDVWLDPKGPCGFLQGDLAQSGVAVKLFDAEDVKNAWTWLYTNANPKPDPTDPDHVPPPGLYHRGGDAMTRALSAAELRNLLDRHTLRRTVASEINQGPLIAPMLAAYAVVKSERSKPPPPSPRSARGDRPGRRTPPKRRAPREIDIAKAGF